MTLTEMVAALRFRLGNKTGIDADITREINFAQERLEEDPTIAYWFLLRFSTLLLLADAKEVTLPPTFLREYDGIRPAIFKDDEFQPLDRMTVEDARKEFGTSTGQPLAYAFADSFIKLYPTPDVDYTLDFPFMSSLEKLVDPSVPTNEWTDNATQMLMNKAGIALAQALRDKDALANFTNDFNVAFAEMMSRVVEREESNFDHQRGGHQDALGR